MIQNLIIGAGPAGLAMAGALRHAKKDFYMIEKSHHIASKWHAHYDRLHLHTVKEYSHLPYMPFPDTYPTYMGAVGMTYEQAGGGRAGLVYRRSDGDLLTLGDRLHHHHVAGLATVECAADHRKKLQEVQKNSMKKKQ